jgi:hypothetical protein
MKQRILSRIITIFSISWILCGSACLDNNDNNERQQTCVAGETRACDNGSDCTAEQVCRGSPGKWGPCECVSEPNKNRDAGKADAAKRPAADASETSVEDAGENDAASVQFEIGNACSNDSDCASEAFCLTSESTAFFGGGAPDGICVADCSEDANTCAQFVNAVCISVARESEQTDDQSDPPALCFEECIIGTRSTSDGVCHELPGVACDLLEEDEEEEGQGFCRPFCTTNADCGERFCSLKHAVCVEDEVSTNENFGLGCDVDDTSGFCDGLCLSLTDDYAVCSHRCIFGEPGDCFGDDNDIPVGGCLFTSEGGEIGDIGYCSQLCDCDQQCLAPEAICDLFEDKNLEKAFGRLGVCVLSDLALGDGMPCEKTQ